MKNYLMVTSIIFHLVLLLSLFWIVPFYSRAIEEGANWAEASQNSEVGTVNDVALLEREGVRYVGYAIETGGSTLYLSGTTDDIYRIGDEVDLLISKHPYEPLDTLMVSILGVHR